MRILIRALLALAFVFAAAEGRAIEKRSPYPMVPAPTRPLQGPCVEGFEASLIPPDGWLHVAQNAGFTWKIMTVGTPHGGSYAADVEYDPALVPQSEWLLSPKGIYGGSLTLWSYGSLYWCRDDYDNCDLEIWLVKGGVAGDGDDILLGLADAAWTANWTWAQSMFDVGGSAPTGLFRLGFRYTGTDGAQVALDDLEYPEPCPVFGADFEAGDLAEWSLGIP